MRRGTIPHKCLKCDHEWTGYSETPGHCPSCKSPTWDEPKRKPSSSIAGRLDKSGHRR